MRIFMMIIGFIALGLGVIGIFLPLIPTTPLVLLASFLFLKSSKKLHTWLLNNKYLGPYIKNYLDKKGIPLKTKIFVLITLWLSILFSVFIVLDKLYLRLLLLTVASIVTFVIMKQRTLRTAI
ncbi:MAG: DUF454 domain-containing protein [Bacilli bacterium]|nr:DUF454 domain-containing protein [Bacilli bacterium]